MFNVGDEVRYLKTGANRKYRDQIGTIIKITDGKKLVKFADTHEMFVKAENMEILADKRPVGAAVPAKAKKHVLADFAESDKVRYTGALPSHSPELIGKVGVVLALHPPHSISVRWDDGTRGGRYYAGNVVPLVEEAPAVAEAEVEEIVLLAAPDPLLAPAPVPEVVVEEPVLEEEPVAPVPPAYPTPGDIYKMSQALLPWKIGDKVRVNRTARDRENGWSTDWDRAMNENIGKKMEIKDIDPGLGYTLGNYWYPWFVLEYIEAAEVTEVFKLEGVIFVVGPERIKIGAYGFKGDIVEKLALAHAAVMARAA